MGYEYDTTLIVGGSTYFKDTNIPSIGPDYCTTSTQEDIRIIESDLKKVSHSLGKMWFSVKMSIDAYTKFIHTVLGIKTELEDRCPNRRVVHLSRHARKVRTRKKNYNRMIKIAEKGI